MKLQSALLGLMLAVTPLAAAAQEPQAAPAAPVTAQAPEELSTTAAVRDVYHALFFDTGIFDAMTEQFLPQYRQTATSSTYYRRARGEQRAALDRVIDGTPQLMREEIIAESFIMADRASARAGELLSPQDITMLATFLREPEWRDFMQRMAAEGAAGRDSSTTQIDPDEADEMTAYAEARFSPQLLQNGEAFMALLVSEMQAAGPRLQTRIQRRLAVEICAALDDRCPRELRDQIRTL